MWRCVTEKSVWYEWTMVRPQTLPLHNPKGRSYTIGLWSPSFVVRSVVSCVGQRDWWQAPCRQRLLRLFFFNEIKLFGDSESLSGFCLFLCVSIYHFFLFLLLKLLKVSLSLCFVFILQRLRHLSLVVEDFGEEIKSTHIKSMPGANHLKGHCRVQNVDLNRRPIFFPVHTWLLCVTFLFVHHTCDVSTWLWYRRGNRNRHNLTNLNWQETLFYLFTVGYCAWYFSLCILSVTATYAYVDLSQKSA